MKLINKAALKETLDAKTNLDMAEAKIGGAVIMVHQDGELVYSETFGSQRVGGDIPLPVDTMFRLASMTKPITAVAALICVDRGLFSLDDKIEKYLPEYHDLEIAHLDESGNIVISGKNPTPPTIKHCLSHSSGIGSMPVGDKLFNMIGDKSGLTLQKIVDRYATNPIAFEPGKAQFYSPILGLDVVARIIELVSGMSFDAFVKKEITEPLGMKDTTFAPTPEQWGRMIGLHNRVDEKSVEVGTPENCVFGDFPVTYTCGGAGLASTAPDYMIFAEMLLGGGKRGNVRIISEESAKAMRTPQLPYEVMPANQIWGLGVRVITDESYGRLAVGSFGWSGAYGSHFWIDPENKVIGIYMKNSCYDGGSGTYTGAMFEHIVTESLNK